MIPAAFEYTRAASVGEALGLLTEHGDEAKLLAGGHSLLPLMKLRLATPSVLIDLGGIPELSYISDHGDHLAIGALTTHHSVATDPLVVREVPLLAHVAAQVGDPQVRHRGTIGGSIAHGDPASDLPAVVLALGGTLVVSGAGGSSREVEAGKFHRGFLETAIGADEMLTEIRVPKLTGGWGFEKLTKRAQDWAIVGAVVVALDGRVGSAPATSDGGTRVGVSLINMGTVPLRAGAVEAAIAAGENADEAARHASDEADPTADINASVEYRRHLATVLVRRALETALA
jgi:carbon-monoxide dehydrogenase medium subunit